MRYAALLRGLNIRSSGRIRMDALKRLLEEAGLSGVSTYIQSGNVLFDAQLSEADARDVIERALKDGANIRTTAVLRTVEELGQILPLCPFTAEEIAAAEAQNPDGESFYICLLPHQPDGQALEKLNAIAPSEDVFVLIERTIYLLLRQSFRTSKLSLRMQRLFPEMTVRNRNTIKKFVELAQQSTGG